MKHIWNKIAILSAILMAAACEPTYPELNEAALPQASDFDVVITVDQETNMATFEMKNTGVVPVWIFGSELIDGKANKKYAYTGNNVTLRFREEGMHSV